MASTLVARLAEKHRMKYTSFFKLIACLPLIAACNGGDEDSDLDGGEVCAAPAGIGPGADASDERAPELGDDLNVLHDATLTMSDGLRMAEEKYGVPIEAKFELDDAGALSLSIYPLGTGLELDAERNKFQELAGDPTASTWMASVSPLDDQEHLTR